MMVTATALLLLSAGCVAATASAEPIRITRGWHGGEARFAGELRVEHGCIVAISGSRRLTPLFDADQALGADARTALPIGQKFQAGAAHLRDDGRGWSVADIERFYGVSIPSACPTRNIVRLHSLEAISEEQQ